MPFPINPYIAGDPVGNSTAFVGREDVLREVLKVLRSPSQNAITLYGQRRIGKTSMLQYLKGRLPQEGKYRPVYFDLQDKSTWRLPRLLAELARTLASELNWPVPTLLPTGDSGPFRGWLKNSLSAMSNDEGLVLLFDEFDVMTDPQSGSAAAEFFPYLRDLLTLDQTRLKFVFVLGRNITDLSSIALSVFKGTPSRRVSLLNQADTATVARLSEQNKTLFWPDEAIEAVWKLTHGHPYLTQALCSQIWEAVYDESPGEIPHTIPEMVEHAIVPALDASRNMLEWLWNGLGPAEKVVSAALAGAGNIIVDETRLKQLLHESGVRILIRELQNAPQMLVEWDILEPADGGYVFRVELLRRWLAIYRPLNRTQDELDRIQPAADNLFQAARAFYEQGDLKRAEDLLIQAIGINPNHLRANELLSEILIGSNRLDEARERLEKLLENAPNSARQRLVQIYLLQATKALNNRVRRILYEKILALDNTHIEARNGIKIIEHSEQQIRQQPTLNLFVMLLGWMGLTVAMLGITKLMLDYFLFDAPIPSNGNTSSTSLIRFAQIAILGLMYLVGWVISLISIRKLYNQVLPFLVRIYSYFVVGGILFVYGHAVYKIFMEDEISAFKHFMVLIVGYIALISLHLLVEESDLGPFVFPLMLAGFIHLLVAVFHYIFTNPQKPEMVWIDLAFVIFMIVLIILLSAKQLYRPLKNLINIVMS